MTLSMSFMHIGMCWLLLHTSLAKPPAATVVTKLSAIREVKPANENKAAALAEENSDMLMEPNDFTPITVVRSQERHYHVPPSFEYRGSIANSGNAQIAPRADFHIETHQQAEQNFFPSFFHETQPLGHSRPYFPLPDSAPIPKFAAPQPELPAHLPQPAIQQRGFDSAILGSGDFGVLRGGTFYPDEEVAYHPEENTDFYGESNGHGRPSEEGFIQKYTYPEEQFANFRDFADINTAADADFSQFVVVYAAKNSSKPATHPHPKNIFEQLMLLDAQDQPSKEKTNEKGVSKAKAKLAKTKLQKNYKKKNVIAKDLDYEPLLALS